MIPFFKIPKDHIFSIGYYLCLFLFSKVVPDTNFSRKKIGHFFGPLQGGINTGITCEKKIFLNFFLEFLVDVVPVSNLKICFFFGFSTDINND
jgi:hypothetical protein